MPTSNKIDSYFYFDKQKSFIIFSILFIIILISSVYFDSIYFSIIPIICLFGIYFIYQPTHLYFLLLFVLPFTIEYDFNKSVFDIPSEPLMFLTAMYTTLFGILFTKKSKEILQKNTISLFLILHLCITYCSTILSTNIIVSLKICIVKTAYILSFYLATLFFIQKKERLIKLLWTLWIPTFFTIITILVLHAIDNFSFDTINNAVIPIYRNHVNYGVFITMLLPFLFYLRINTSKQSIKRLFIDISILTTLAAIYFTYTRGAWLALLAMPIYIFIIKMRWSKYLLIITTLAIILFSTYILSNYNYLKYAPNYDTTIYHDDLNAHLNSTFEMEDMSTVERFYRWLAAIKMTKHTLWHGVGAGNFTANYKLYTVAAYQTYISDNEEQSTVHNYFLLLLTEQGIFALILFVIFIYYIILNIEKIYHHQQSKENKILVMAIAMSIMTFLVNNTLSDLVEANKVGSLFFVNLALISFINRNNVKPKI
ncbi:MAG: O-antigen ligase family protein [Sphingobacteriales bacterium]|nr:MAG: O-antigen ligase family protein [Sphingobacteriales bacterium]